MWYIGNDESPSLSHHGILGMKWGIRRYQNVDGSYTSAGKKRYGLSDGKSYGGVKKASGTKNKSTANDTDSSGEKKGMSTAKKVAIGTGVAAAAGLAAYGAYKYNKIVKNEADRLTIAKGKALYDHLVATRPLNPPNISGFTRRSAQAGAEATSFVSIQTQANKKLSNARRFVKDFKKEAETTSDLGSRMKFYDKQSKNKLAKEVVKNAIKSDKPKPKLSFGTDNSSGFSNADFQKTLDSLKSVSAKSLNTVNSAGDDVLSFTKDLAKMNMNDLYKLGF